MRRGAFDANSPCLFSEEIEALCRLEPKYADCLVYGDCDAWNAKKFSALLNSDCLLRGGDCDTKFGSLAPAQDNVDCLLRGDCDAQPASNTPIQETDTDFAPVMQLEAPVWETMA